MITVNIKFLLHLDSSPELRNGKKVVSMDLEDGATFGQLLRSLESCFGSALSAELYDPIRHRTAELVLAMINGVLSQNLEGTDTVLQQGDSIIFVPLATGG